MVGSEAVRPQQGPTLAAKVAFLQRPEAYPPADRPARVETVETHLAWVFFTRRHAYKLKKPVQGPYLDFRTLEARRRVCEEELRLNRRLAPGVYLGLVALARGPAGELGLDGGGEVVEWLVKMRRLPAAQMLDRRIVRQELQPAELDPLIEVLVRFYQQAPAVEMTAAAYREALAAEVRASAEAIARAELAVPPELGEAVPQALLELLAREPQLFDRRVRAGRVVEAHGDLRPEHVCLLDPPVIIDCLEFYRPLRLLDPVSELSFLALECERLGARWVGERLLAGYAAGSGDRVPDRLLLFYRGWHACARAKVALWHLQEPEVRDRAHWLDKAAQYLRLGAGVRALARSG
ncbi:MAG: hypothetical protein KatS3mg102_2801 [Planctomycetota bacterium]|nr:MAG: hypothetical protein KatS3mg102_2801 [Planctomycetota bacterium]